VRRCVFCHKVLPEPKRKGGRRREFCNNACKQQQYLQDKQMHDDATRLAEPFWKMAYGRLKDHYLWLEGMVQDRLKDLAEERKSVDKLEKRVQYYVNKIEELKADYRLRLKAAGLSDQDIEEFEAYWQRQIKDGDISS
jgi:hypothetical protein